MLDWLVFSSSSAPLLLRFFFGVDFGVDLGVDLGVDFLGSKHVPFKIELILYYLAIISRYKKMQLRTNKAPFFKD